MSAAVTSGATTGSDTLVALLLRNARGFGDKPAIREKRHGIWKTRTWAEHADTTSAIARGLAARGFRRGDRLAVLGDNRPALYQAQLAAMMLGGAAVPCWPDADTEWLAHVLADAGVSIVVAEDQDQVEKLLDIKDRLPALRDIVFTDPRGVHHDDVSFILSLDAMVAGASVGVVEATAVAGDPCVICYVTPASGPPVAVPLAHADLLAAAEAVRKISEVRPDDEYFAYLPLAWVAEQIYGVALPLLTGFACSCPEDPETARRDLRELGPTILLAPPRIWRSLLSEIESKAAHSTPMKRRLCAQFLPRTYGDAAPARGGFLAEWLLSAPLRDQLGLGRLRWAHTGGLALAPHVQGFFTALGVDLRQGPTLGDHPALIPLMTDLPNLVTLPDGSSVDAAVIETTLCHNPYIADAVVLADPGGRLAALIAIDAVAMGDWAQERGLPYTTSEELMALPDVRDLLRDHIRRSNARLPERHRVVRYALLTAPPAATRGEASLSRVLQRRIALDLSAERARDLFTDPPGPDVETMAASVVPAPERTA